MFPVPVLGDEPVVIPVELDPKLEERAAHMRSLLAASARVDDARKAQDVCFEATAKLIEKQKNSLALARARGGYESAKATGNTLADELAQLKEYTDLTPAATKVIGSIESRLAALRRINEELKKHVDVLAAVVAREDNPALALADAVQAQIALHLGRGEVDEAINAYDQLVMLLDAAGQKATSDEAKAAREKLKAEWAPKDDAHKAAREYLLKTWPTLGTIPEMHGSLKRLEAEAQVCIDRKDRYTLRKLLIVFSSARVKLNELFEPLDPTSDRAAIEAAKDAGEKLAALEQKISDFVNKKE
jgi:hypothetical protein